MKRRRVIIFLLSLVAAVILTVLLWLGNGETGPEYQGKRLSEWTLIYGDERFPARHPEAAEAIRHIGTNALPYYLKWIREEPSPARRTIYSQFGRLPAALSDNPALRRMVAGPAARLAFAVTEAFGLLGPEARTSIPELLSLMRASQNAASFRAVRCLESLHRGGAPEFLEALLGSDNPYRAVAAEHFFTPQNLGTNKLQALPLLAECFKRNDPVLASAVARTLQMNWKSEPGVVPMLVEGLASCPPAARADVMRALGAFGRQAQAGIPALTKMLDDPDMNVRYAATNALFMIGPASKASPGSTDTNTSLGRPSP